MKDAPPGLPTQVRTWGCSGRPVSRDARPGTTARSRLRVGRCGALTAARGVAIVAALVISGCASVSPSTPPPRVTLELLELLPSTDLPRFRVTLLIDNLETVAIPVTGVGFSARLGGEGVLSGTSSSQFTVEALDTYRLELELASDRVSSRTRLVALANGASGTLPYELDGELVIGGRPPRSLEFSQRGRVPLALGAER